MADLRVAGSDAEHLLLVDEQGATHRVRLDEHLHRALRDASRAGTSSLSPREIQERLRGGASAEQVAKAAGVSVERIRRWEGPILAERAHALELAGRTRYARPPDGALSGPLRRLVDQRLTQAGLAGEWDAHRDAEIWVVSVQHAKARAEWSFDGTSLHALDPHAESLGWREPPRAVDSVRERSPRGRGQLPSWESIMADAPPPNMFPG